MRTNTLKPVNIILALLFIFSACTKEDILIPKPVPGDGVVIPPATEKGSFFFSTNVELSGQPYHSSNLHAVVSISNDSDVVVIKDTVLVLNLNGPVTTQSIELPVGNYKLTSLRFEYGYVNTHFAAPIAGSARASLVQKPLALHFKLEKGISKPIPVEMLKVQNGEKPQAYGYPSGAFDHGQSDANPYMKIKLRAMMKIGDVLYDSIPASLTLTTWNANGEMNTTYSALSAGTNQVQLLKSAVKYDFLVSKWGTNHALTLKREDVNEDSVYTFGSSKEAKKLKSEILFRQVNGVFVAESKTDFLYDGAGKLSKIEYRLKKQDNTPYLAMTDRFEYNGTKVNKINRYNEENNTLIGLTSFGYDNQGKVISMAQKENGTETNATVEYFNFTHDEVKISYDYPGSIEMNYYMNFAGGNMISSTANTANHNSELGMYSYDLSINPYRHMNWPDIFLSHHSKNNLNWQSKEYHGSYPSVVAYSFNYTYDGDGYPKELIKHFRSYLTGNFVYSTKTVFAY